MSKKTKHVYNKTNKFLISHDVASPLTKGLQEVAGFEIQDENDERYEKSLWKVSLVKVAQVVAVTN